jgi:tol-pal system protein YbgF
VRIAIFTGVLGLLLPGLVGCHDHSAMEQQLADLRLDLGRVQAVQSNQSIQMEDLQSRMLLLSDEVDSNRIMIQRIGGTGGIGEGAGPMERLLDSSRPQELPVVRLSPREPEPQEESGEIALQQLDSAGNLIQFWDSQPPPRAGQGDGLQGPPAPPQGPVQQKVSSGRGFDSRPVMLYNQGMELLKAKNHQQAIMVFEDFIHQWPGHEYADNCMYWIGEALYDQGKFESALASFEGVAQRYPDGNKVPDALLKAAFCHDKLGAPERARELLDRVIRTYPGTEAARIAGRSRGGR